MMSVYTSAVFLAAFAVAAVGCKLRSYDSAAKQSSSNDQALPQTYKAAAKWLASPANDPYLHREVVDVLDKQRQVLATFYKEGEAGKVFLRFHIMPNYRYLKDTERYACFEKSGKLVHSSSGNSHYYAVTYRLGEKIDGGNVGSVDDYESLVHKGLAIKVGDKLYRPELLETKAPVEVRKEWLLKDSEGYAWVDKARFSPTSLEIAKLLGDFVTFEGEGDQLYYIKNLETNAPYFDYKKAFATCP